jgi:metallo-beta-lactamase class B
LLSADNAEVVGLSIQETLEGDKLPRHYVVAFCLVFLVACSSDKKVVNRETLDPSITSTILTDYPSQAIDKDMVIREIQQGFYVVTHSFPWPHNSLAVEMSNTEILLVDTPYTPEATNELLQWIDKKYGSRQITAINTGYHYDNLGGNEALLKAGIKVYGSDAIPTMLNEHREALRTLTLSWLTDTKYSEYYEAHKKLKYIPPNHLFPLNTGLELSFGAERVDIYFPGPTHTPENVVVYFKEREILFGGCMILAGESIGNTSDADMKAWPQSIENLKKFVFTLLIPGHGDRMDRELLNHTQELLSKG